MEHSCCMSKHSIYYTDMLKKLLFIFICFGLFLNQAGRIDLGNNIVITVLDGSVGLFLLFSWIDKIKNNYTFSKDVFVRPFLIFVSIAIISLLLNIWHYSWQQGLVAGLYLVRFSMYCLMYPAIKSQFKQNKKFVILSLLVTSVCILLAGLLQYFFYSNLRNLIYLGWDDHLYRLFNTFFDPNFAGAFTVLIFIFLTTLFMQSLRKSNKYYTIFLGFLLLLTLLEIFLTFSRSSIIMLCVSSIVYFYLLKRLKYFFLVIIILISVFFLTSPKASTENTNFFRIASSEARVTTEQTALQIILKNPLFGVGFDAYRYAQLRYGYRSIADIQKSHADSGTDNSFLFVFATTGIFGLLAYCFMQIKIIKTMYGESLQKNRLFSLLILTSFLGLYMNSIFINSLFYPSIILWMMIMLGVRDYT